jgi:hypothetical protein
MEHNENTNNENIYDDFEENPDGFAILKQLIDTEETQYIPYYSYNNNFMIRTNLDDNRRLDRINTNINIDELSIAIQNTLNWLYKNIWTNFEIHGDLTDNNIIYQNNNIYIIDWIQTATIFRPSLCTLWFILADIVDFLNTFYTKFPQLLLLSEINMEDFNVWYNLIKTQEDNMKTHGTNKKQCKSNFITHNETINLFFDFLLRKYGIYMYNIEELNTTIKNGGNNSRYTKNKKIKTKKIRKQKIRKIRNKKTKNKKNKK